jgi:hypothetical protein
MKVLGYLHSSLLKPGSGDAAEESKDESNGTSNGAMEDLDQYVVT